MKQQFDTIVLGLGAMGSAAAYQLAKGGDRVLGIDQFSPPHAYGSSHGDTRIMRQAIGEGAPYTPLSLRSYELWKEIERETGMNLLHLIGGLIISSSAISSVNHTPGFFENTLAAARRYNIRHETLDAAQIRRRFPQFRVQDDEVGYYEYNAGYLRPEECVRAQLLLAEKYGAALHRNESVLRFGEHQGLVHVQTAQSDYMAEQLIVTAGPWLPTLLEADNAQYFTVLRQVLYWFDIKTSTDRFLPQNCPIFIWELQGDKRGIYGFPAIDGVKGGVKIATEQYHSVTTASTVNREVGEAEMEFMFNNYVEPYFPDLSANCLKALTCLYTVTPDSGFVIDRHPRHSNILLASPCSGHGFKHSAAIGEVLAQWVTEDRSELDISHFRLDRFKSK